MLKATDYEILRGVRASGLAQIPLDRQPLRVATLLDERTFNEDQCLIHMKTVFLEDRVHDWNWRNGQFRYYTRVADVADVLIVYQIEEFEPVARFDAMTGKPLSQ